jgi:hypothetical protein
MQSGDVPQWSIRFFAEDEPSPYWTRALQVVVIQQIIGQVDKTGNANFKP